jgi:hypothetical protein
MNNSEQLLVSKPRVDSLLKLLADARTDREELASVGAGRASEYMNWYGNGIECALEILGLMEVTDGVISP